jgi:hypothetical protein
MRVARVFISPKRAGLPITCILGAELGTLFSTIAILVLAGGHRRLRSYGFMWLWTLQNDQSADIIFGPHPVAV